MEVPGYLAPCDWRRKREVRDTVNEGGLSLGSPY